MPSLSLHRSRWLLLAGALYGLQLLGPLTSPARAGSAISVQEDPDENGTPAAAPKASPHHEPSTHHSERRHEKAAQAKAEQAPEAAHPEPAPEQAPAADSKPAADGKPAQVAAAASAPADTPPPVPAQNSVALPSDSWSTLVEHWQKRTEFLAANDEKRVEEEEREVERIKKDLAIENMLTASAALVQEADAALHKGAAADALAKCSEAVKLSPELNLGWLCIARATFLHSFVDVGPTISALNRALSVTFKDPRARRNAVADWALLFLFGFALACGGLVVLLIARYWRLFTHDFHHLFPQGVSRWQSVVVAAALLCLPALLGGGLLGSVALAAVAIALSLARSEAIALAVAFALLGLAQFTAGEVLQASAFGRTAQDVYLLERGDAPDAAAARLQSRHDKGLGDYATAYALGHFHKRMGHLTAAKDAYEAARKLHETPEVLNNIGNVLFLLGDTEGARQKYHDANVKNPNLAAPLWNLAKLYYREGKLEQGQKIVNDARQADPDSSSLDSWNSSEMKANLYLADVPLPDHEITRLADTEADAIVTGAGATWPLLTGRATMGIAILIALLAAALIGLAQWLQPRFHPATHCEKCGRPVCSRCEPELGTSSAMCGQCISVFVRRTGVDAPDRVRKEGEVRAFRRRHRLLVRALGFVVGGGGHIFSGRIVAGVIFLSLFGILLGQVIFWHGILRSPVPVHLSASAIYVSLYVIGFALVYGLSIFHLIRHEEAD